MNRINTAQLQTLADVQRQPRAGPKPHTRLERAIAKKAARMLDERLLRKWALDVKHRDAWKDRKTGRRVRRSLELAPDRAEAHHLENRENKVTRYDVRNGATLSYETHDQVERGIYRIEGTVFFTGADGATYIDATFPIVFVRQ